MPLCNQQVQHLSCLTSQQSSVREFDTDGSPKTLPFCASLLLPYAVVRYQCTLSCVTVCLHSADLHVHQNPRCQHMPILLLSPIIINDDDPPVIVCSITPSMQLTTNFRRSFSSFSLSSVALQLVRMPMQQTR
jgi:hypothetical protein